MDNLAAMALAFALTRRGPLPPHEVTFPQHYHGVVATSVRNTHVAPVHYAVLTLKQSQPTGEGGDDLIAGISHLALNLDYRSGEGHLLIYPGATQAEVAEMFRRFEAYGWEELSLDETGDEPEISEDGTIRIELVRPPTEAS